MQTHTYVCAYIHAYKHTHKYLLPQTNRGLYTIVQTSRTKDTLSYLSKGIYAYFKDYIIILKKRCNYLFVNILQLSIFSETNMDKPQRQTETAIKNPIHWSGIICDPQKHKYLLLLYGRLSHISGGT